MIFRMKRGALIVLEGGDCCGKSTQCKRLIDELTKVNVKTRLMSFPDRTTPVGNVINQYLRKTIEIPDKAIHLLFSANRWELEPKMNELIENGTTLVVDRYSYSGVAFSTAKHNMDLNWCWQMEIGLPKPDLVLFLETNDADKRNGFGDERYESKSFQKQVLEKFEQLKDSSWKMIDAGKDIESVHKQIMIHVREVLDNIDDKPLQRFT